VISSPLADHLPTARSCERWPQGKSRLRTTLAREGASTRETNVADRLFFNLADLDWDDEDAVAARVQKIWEFATTELSKESADTAKVEETEIKQGECDD
jgi:hypothetical protein